MAIIRNESWWTEMNDDNRNTGVKQNIIKLIKRKLSVDVVVSSFLTSAYIPGVPSTKNNSHQCTITYITPNVNFVNY